MDYNLDHKRKCSAKFGGIKPKRCPNNATVDIKGEFPLCARCNESLKKYLEWKSKN